MIKAIFFDIDGTLVDHSNPEKSIIPESTLLALRALRNKGIKLLVATGRIPSMIGFMEQYFEFDGFVSLNGQLVVERDGRVLHRMAHKKETIKGLIPLAERHGFPCLIIEEEQCFSVKPSPMIHQHFQWLDLPVPEKYDIARLNDHDVLQFLAYISMEEKELLEPLPHIEITGAGGEILDIIPEGGGKEIGIAAAAAHYGFKRDEIMVFGDGENDGRMVAWAGIGVAMGNGVPNTKRAADYVTAPVNEDGIMKAMLHFGLLTPEDLKKAK